MILWVAVLAFIALSGLGRAIITGVAPIVTRWVTATAAAAILVAYTAIAIWYASLPEFFDNAEPSMVAVAWLFHVGQPIYHTLDSAERYTHIYGPLAFALHGWVLAWLGPVIQASKGLGAMAGIATLAAVYDLLSQKSTRLRALVLTASYALLLLGFRNYSFWTRPDPLQILAVSLGLLGATRCERTRAALIVGITSGCAWNLKFTGPFYTLPTFVLLQRAAGGRSTSLALVIACIVAALPFVSFPNVSFTNYLAWILVSGRTGLLLSTIRQNLEWSVFMCLPIFLSHFAARSRVRAADTTWVAAVAALLIGICFVVIAASKPGAGPYHLLPFLPVIFYLTVWPLRNIPIWTIRQRVMSPCAAWACVAVAIALAQQAQLIPAVRARMMRNEIRDIRAFAATQAGVIDVGYGSTEAFSFERPILVFENNSYFLDQPAIREQQLQGLEVPRSTVEALENCRVTYWLIPKGEVPFSGRNSYTAVLGRPLFDREFRDTFFRTYRKVGVITYFDVWQCRGL